MTVSEESIYESASPRSITSIKSLKSLRKTVREAHHCKYEGWLRVFEGTLNLREDNIEWHDGFCVCRSDEQSLICYPTEGVAKTFARFLPSKRLDDPLSPKKVVQLPTASNYLSPINAYEQLPPLPPPLPKRRHRILPGLSATIDRVGYKRNRNIPMSPSTGNYASRSATVSRYYGAEITETEPKVAATIRSKSAKSLAQRFYYSTLRTIRGWFSTLCYFTFLK